MPSAAQGLALTRIGQVQAQRGTRVLDGQGRDVSAALAGFDHFKS
jgi:thiamine monophosphate kinase